MKTKVPKSSLKSAKDWLALIDKIMAEVHAHSFREGGKVFATSAGLAEEPFVKALLLAAGVLTPMGRLDEHFVEDNGGNDPLRIIGRPEIYRGAMNNFYPGVGEKRPLKKPDYRVLQRMLYVVDEELFDKLRSWSCWRRGEGTLVSRLTIRRHAKYETERRLELTNPSGQMPDREWDTPQ